VIVKQHYAATEAIAPPFLPKGGLLEPLFVQPASASNPINPFQVGGLNLPSGCNHAIIPSIGLHFIDLILDKTAHGPCGVGWSLVGRLPDRRRVG
jgi:hypothetical protein